MEECRDLRASLIHQWAAAHRTPSSSDIEELVRFNEAIDLTLVESIVRARGRARRAREMFLAVLGHDLRTPLGAVVMASEYLVMRGELTERDLRLATRIRSSAKRMSGLVNDLLDFTRCRLGQGIPISPVRTSFDAIAAEVVEEIRAVHPGCELRCDIRESVHGSWDAGRLWQALSNLIENAVSHGRGAPVRVTVAANGGDVVASVHNAGSAISAKDQERIFDPFEHCAKGEADQRPGGGLGLGLYIAREIAVAHGGSISISSSPESGTTFALRVPRET
jgi:signal transduction histidine kinase